MTARPPALNAIEQGIAAWLIDARGQPLEARLCARVVGEYLTDPRKLPILTTLVAQLHGTCPDDLSGLDTGGPK